VRPGQDEAVTRRAARVEEAAERRVRVPQLQSASIVNGLLDLIDSGGKADVSR